MLEIIKVFENSIAQELGFEVGDKIVSVNGREVDDFIDYTYLDGECELYLEVLTKDGEEVQLEIEKDEFEPFGVEVKDESKIRTCKNKCAFCFVDQLPKGMRESLYVKDDDWRYSLMCGNYVTLTNLKEDDLNRICEYGISPLYVSVHAYSSDVRLKLVKNPNTRQLITYMEKMRDYGIKLHTQVVMCKGINDGEVLRETVEKLGKLDNVLSIAVVPVGLTKHREGLYPLVPVDKESASIAIDICEDAKTRGINAYCSDEMYLRAERELPNYSYYGDFDQIENGVGLIAKFEEEFNVAIKSAKLKKGSYGIITGYSAAELMKKTAIKLQKLGDIEVEVYPIRNDFFGESVTVAGLVTGGDIIAQLKGLNLPKTLLIPSVMLKEFETVFLDGVTVDKLQKELAREVVVVNTDGESFARAFIEE